MPEHSTKGLAVVADYETYSCDECGGAVAFNGRTLLSNPPKRENVCGACGRVYVLDKAYPAVTYRVPGLPDATVLVVFGGRSQAVRPTQPVPDNDFRDPSG